MESFFFCSQLIELFHMPCGVGYIKMPRGVGHITKNSANVFSACRKRRLKETGRGDWESPPLYIFLRDNMKEGELRGD